MPDTMQPQPFAALLRWILTELEARNSIFGIDRSLFYTPAAHPPYELDLYGRHLAAPVGPAAGPHTQLAQNIVSAWLAGGRFIELKTVQIMDELEIPRPCIDMADEGYNVEWSQELKLEQSAREYINAWALVHILHRLLGYEGRAPLGTIFNMSVGYNLEGVQSPPMTRFMDRMHDASAELAEIRETLAAEFPQFADVEIPSQLTTSVTLSTMHGCPPDEIERIARYLLEARGLHTIVKLNPTLLGRERVMHILHGRLGYTGIDIPDRIFAHDLQYGRAVALIKSLKATAAAQGLTFAVKLSNTLAMANHRGALPGEEMYMSGRALYPVTINLFQRLVSEFDGDLNVSYSAGADALNVSTILACGARPVTVASDLLKPGGYARLGQYLERLQGHMRARGAASLDALAEDRLANLERAAAEALADPRYAKAHFPHGLPKVETPLPAFDCIEAPCQAACPVCQDVPGYARAIAHGDDEQALEVILRRNPLPGITGYICTHRCQARCTRNNYDQPVAIRDLKRFAFDHARISPAPAPRTGHRVAVVGAGPSGLSAASALALSGVEVTVFEARPQAGGMPALAPSFRLPAAVVQADVERVEKLGVEIVLNHPITAPPQALLDEGYEAVYLACGFQADALPDVEGLDTPGVYTALDLLRRVAQGERPELGARVLVVGGGNTAVDAARTAARLCGRPVTVVYRRTRAEMPAAEEELADLFAEGNALVELASPTRVVVEDGHVAALECVRNDLAEPGADGRRRPVAVPGSEFRLAADAVIVAVGQRADLGFLEKSGIALGRGGAIAVDEESGEAAAGVYAGGDVARGPATVVEACADGRRAAEAICRRLGVPVAGEAAPAELSHEDYMAGKRARARRVPRHEPERLPAAGRGGFDLVERTLEPDAARAEAARCLQCAALCDKCVEVCPNRANYAYAAAPVSAALPVLACRNGALIVASEEPFAVRQPRQILHVDDLCNECGNCATFCVHEGRPYADKPRLFLAREAFAREQSNAFHLEGDTLYRREGGDESQLTIDGEAMVYEDAHVRVRFGPGLAVQEMALVAPFGGTRTLRPAAEMAVILQGIRGSLPFLG